MKGQSLANIRPNGYPTKQLIQGCLLLGLMSFLAACTSTTPRTAEMVATDAHIFSTNSELVYVTVGNLLVGDSVVPQENEPQSFAHSFQVAVVESLSASKLYRIAEVPEDAFFKLDITILKGSEAVAAGYGNAGLGTAPGAISTHFVANWALKDADTGEVIYSKDITTAGTDGRHFFYGAPLSRNATENGASRNIKAGLEWLSRRAQNTPTANVPSDG